MDNKRFYLSLKKKTFVFEVEKEFLAKVVLSLLKISLKSFRYVTSNFIFLISYGLCS